MISFTGILASVVGAAPAGAGAAGEAASAVEVQSVWDFILKGGFMMIPIGICSLIGLAVISERLVSLRRPSVIPPDFLSGLRKLLKAHPGDRDRALKYCNSDQSPLANVFAAGIKHLGAPHETMEKYIQDAGQREVLKLRKFVRVLSVIAAITPLMGLLGTIFGMIKAFQTVATSADALGRAELLAGGIYEAMITTAAGLTVAIPVLIAYHWITATIEKLVMEIDGTTVEFLDEYAEQQRGGAMAREPVTAKEEKSEEAALKKRGAA